MWIIYILEIMKHNIISNEDNEMIIHLSNFINKTPTIVFRKACDPYVIKTAKHRIQIAPHIVHVAVILHDVEKESL